MREALVVLFILPLTILGVGVVWKVFLETRPRESESPVAQIDVDLPALKHSIDYAQFQELGLFVSLPCPECDFSEGGAMFRQSDDSDSQVRVTLLRSAQHVFVSFFGAESSRTSDRVREVLGGMRLRHPGYEDAFRLVDTETLEHVPLADEQLWLMSLGAE